MKQVVYVASPSSKQIHVWQLDPTGKLVLLQVVNAPGQVQPMIIHPDKKHVYVGMRLPCGLITYRILADGKLRQASIALLSSSPSYISIDMLGNYLFFASYSGNCVSVSKIVHDGLVIMSPAQQIRDIMTPHSVNIHLLNQCLLVPCLKEDQIRLFNIGLDGQLTPYIQKSVKTVRGSGPRHMAFHPNSNYAYCVNELNGTVDVLTISKNSGQYYFIQTLEIMPAVFNGNYWAADIHITPNGRFLYSSERSTSTLTIFNISKNGSRLSVVDYCLTEAQPRGFNIDDSGRFLISSGQQSNHIAVYEIDQISGKLSILARYPVGNGPIWVTILAYN